MASEQENQAKTWFEQAVKDAYDAAFEAGLVYPFTNVKYSERRRQLAHDAQDAANEAMLYAQTAEQKFYNDDYDAVFKAGHQVRDCLEKVRELVRLASIDEAELCHCPKCMTRVSRLSARPQPTDSLADGTRCWMKRFQCSNCATPWREIYTSDGILVQRMAEALD